MQRKVHYWNWFVVYGTTSGLIYFHTFHRLSSETLWMFLAGLIGVFGTTKQYGDSIGRPFDILIGFLFVSIGLIGILHNLGMDLVGSGFISQAMHDGRFLGLSLCGLPSIIHTGLGVVSLSHGFYVSPPKPTIAVQN